MLTEAAVKASRDPGPVSRPYAWTQGRTRPAVDLPIETQLVTTPQGRQQEVNLGAEQAAVMRCCHEARSLAEVAATLKLPLGVARVLVSDLAGENLLAVHQPKSLDGQAHRALLERVLRGLRTI